jgi:mannose-6-phosphate isomerase-like protein (cupin superfamily)
VEQALITVPNVDASLADYPVVITVGGVASESALVRVSTSTLTLGSPSPVMRYVIGNHADNSSYLQFSGPSPIGQNIGPDGYSGQLWQSARCPVDDNGGSTDLGSARGGLPVFQGCASFSFISFGTETTPIHHTDTIDYWMVLQGAVDLITDHDIVHLKVGDTVIVRGSDHAWSKTSKEPCMGVSVSLKAGPLPGQSSASPPSNGGL